uniref:Interferon alpha/beta receptor 2-like n=2 Tax=Hippocampus comes TaxID=109280 RepID=A0A3Q2Z4T2_HIPCM
MNWMCCSLNVMFLLESVLGILPAPSNVSVNSVNFLHILHWNPGPATPPGVQYKVFSRLSGEKEKKTQNDNTTTATSLQLNLDKYKYYFTVQAFYNGTWSPESEEVSFSPFEQTIIGPPEVTVTECGNCIQINMSLPEADKSSGIPNNDIMAIYKAKFRVLWKRSNKIEEVYKTEARSVKINNLEKGKQYCVQIQTEITMNKNTEPSTWVCTTTSIAELDRVPVLGITLGLLICFTGALMTLTCCLYYTGFLCKLQASLPRALIMALMHAKSLPVEETSPDLISVCSDTSKQKYTITTSLCPTPRITCSGMKDEEVGEEEEENEGSNFYINRDGENLSRESSCHDSCNVLRTSLTAKSRAEADTSDISSETVPAELDQLKTGVENDTFLSRWPEMEVKEQLIFELGEEMDEKTVNMSENVNLSSVTLTAIAIHEKGQLNSEDSHADSLRLSELEPLMFAATKQSLLHTDMPTDSDDLTSTECTCFGETGYEYRCDDLETQDKLGKEQFLGYMG